MPSAYARVMSIVTAPLTSLRRTVAAELRDRVAGADAEERAWRIWHSPGQRRFSAEEPICRVQGHAAMYAGGLRALLLQMLHPLAMAGVGGHSGYRGDPWGRLQRTSEFIAVTTFGTIADADATIARIRAIHERVRGKAPDGRSYRASDPHLLAWVHVAEVDSFLTAHQRYARHPLTPQEADTYVSQAAWTGEALGMTRAPHSVAELKQMLRDYEPELALTQAAREAADFLLREPPLPVAARPGYWMLAAGAIEMLPEHARSLFGRSLHGWAGRLGDRAVLRPLGQLGTNVVDWALADPADVRNSGQRPAAVDTP